MYAGLPKGNVNTCSVHSSLASRKNDWHMPQHLGIHALEVYV
jgi:hypothetical protein